MNYEQFLEQMKEDLTARFAKDLPPEPAGWNCAGCRPSGYRITVYRKTGYGRIVYGKPKRNK